MRVTTGLARGRKLVAPQGLDTRPSSDMTKQAVFNIVQNYVEGSTFLDLFAGSGQMGIEALSRGPSTRSLWMLPLRPSRRCGKTLPIAALRTRQRWRRWTHSPF